VSSDFTSNWSVVEVETSPSVEILTIVIRRSSETEMELLTIVGNVKLDASHQ